MKNMEYNCTYCNEVFNFNKKKADRKIEKGWRLFCSKECAGKQRSKDSIVELKCIECNKEYSKRKCEVNKTNNFCSSSCACSYNNKKLRSGINNPNYKTGNNSYRKLAFSIQDKKCYKCGFEKEYALEVHHIDHDRNNNDKSNLIILCANCHSGIHKKVLNLED